MKKTYFSCGLPLRPIEQMRGIEPPSPTWKEGVMNHYTTSAKQKTPNFSVRGFLILFKNYYILSYIRIL